MMTTILHVLAAGSLKRAFIPLCQHFSQQTGIPVSVDFGPAGLLRERIEAGERCDLFASANTQHPQTLLANGRAQAAATFAFNRLNLTARKTAQTENADWLSLLANPALRLGTSTPGCDPSGDYTFDLLARVEAEYPDMALTARANRLVGGRDSLIVPAGEIASAWLIRQNLTDLFIGYAHYAQALEHTDDLRILALPEAYQTRCEYQLARLSDAAQPLEQFIVGSVGQAFLREAGFLTLNGK
ncbi:substrate-binding domain-containing protein [Scandinavium sp. H11S7]|uniref:Substrate-binding domain-containing protein n=1 Tax=Scandinavium hiltneri TaxID=2926519 RepID=A0ABT2E1U7_9ENTR|nr:substrate-binding domain-containing protein [Scandinavium hiltneri]MCS2159247.1 substrate-binding domain-containing protein [Scandinavium hiltneri]MCS2161857.1 substrate-binding domain-containing protein [Scandinavium hiltneri]